MRPFRLLLLRRLIAACLAVCLGFFSAESLTAEVHDGDATHAELLRADGAQEHGAAHRAGQAPDRVSDAARAASVDVASVGGQAPDSDRAGPDATASVADHAADDASSATPHGGPSHGPGAPEHATHVCHCGHGHLVPPSHAPVPPLRLAAGGRTAAPAAEPPVLLSRAGEPALRPPIG